MWESLFARGRVTFFSIFENRPLQQSLNIDWGFKWGPGVGLGVNCSLILVLYWNWCCDILLQHFIFGAIVGSSSL